MKAFFQSPWVIGTATGLLSGILVFVISSLANRAVEKKKHRAQIESANMEIFRTVRPYVAENGLPPIDILNAIIQSSARKYLLKTEELFSVRIICEELTKEVIENIYVSSDKKSDISKSLMSYITQYEELSLNKSTEIVSSNKTRKEKESFSDSISPTLISALVTVFVTGLFVVIITMKRDGQAKLLEFLIENDDWIILSFALLGVSATTVALLMRNDFFEDIFNIIFRRRKK